MTVHARNGQGRIRAVRLAIGISQADLARRIGIDASLVSRIERGRIPSWPRFRRSAAAALGVSEAVLFPEVTAAARPPDGSPMATVTNKSGVSRERTASVGTGAVQEARDATAQPTT